MKTVSYVDIFFNRQDAVTWIEGHDRDHSKNEWDIIEESIVLQPSGGYRAGIVFKHVQGEFNFG